MTEGTVTVVAVGLRAAILDGPEAARVAVRRVDAPEGTVLRAGDLRHTATTAPPVKQLRPPCLCRN